MRKILGLLLSIVFAFVALVPANAIEVTNGQSQTGRWDFASNGNSILAAWNNCESEQNSTIYARIQRGSKSWKLPTVIGVGQCYGDLSTTMLANGTSYIFWLNEGELYFSKSSPSGTTFSSAQKFPKTATQTVISSKVFASGNNLTVFVVTQVDGNLFAETWDLTRNKWKKQTIGDLLPDSVFIKCDIDDESCAQNIEAPYLVTNSKGQQVFVISLTQQRVVDSINYSTYATYVFKRGSSANAWSREILDSFGPTDSYISYGVEALTISQKGKIALGMHRGTTENLDGIRFYTSASFTKQLKPTDTSVVEDLEGAFISDIANVGDDFYATYARCTNESCTEYFGKLGKLSQAKALPANTIVVSLGTYGGKLRMFTCEVASELTELDGTISIQTKTKNGWTVPKVALKLDSANVKILTVFAEIMFFKSHVLLAADGVYNDGEGDVRLPYGLYIEKIK